MSTPDVDLDLPAGQAEVPMQVDAALQGEVQEEDEQPVLVSVDADEEMSADDASEEHEDEQESETEADGSAPSRQNLVGMTEDELHGQLDQVYRRWRSAMLPADEEEADNGQVAPAQPQPPKTVREVAAELFGMDVNKRPVSAVLVRLRDDRQRELLQLMEEFNRKGLLDSPLHGASLTEKFNELIRLLDSSFNMLMFEADLESSRESGMSGSHAGATSALDLWRFRPLQKHDLKPNQDLILNSLAAASRLKLRKSGLMLYQERVSPEGHGTYAYEEYCSIQEFVQKLANKNTRFDLWQHQTQTGSLKQVVEYLEQCVDPELPTLMTNRTVTAWRDGLYFAELPAFHYYKEGRLPFDVIACKYFDLRFDHKGYNTFMEIETPIRRILDTQGYSAREQSFVLAMLGRLIFEPGDRDTWEIIPFILGLAGTGKSSIIGAVESFYMTEDVQALNNSQEEVFGLESLLGKKLILAYDIKKEFRLKAGDLQTMASREQMSIARKHKKAISTRWMTPLIFAGNELPSAWNDKFDSMARRLLIFDFKNKAEIRDYTLKAQIRQTYASFYRLCVQAYHYWSGLYGTQDIWAEGKMPERFRQNQQIIREADNLLEQFLSSPFIKIDPADQGLYVKEEHFLKHFEEWCKIRGHKYKGVRNADELYLAIKNRRGKVEQQVEKIYPVGSKCRVRGTWFVGLRSSTDEIREAEAHDDGDD